jgi:threonine dehydratase
VCGAERDIAEPMPWRCPNATLTDHHHVMHIVSAGAAPLSPPGGGAARSTAERSVESGFSAHRDELAWAAYASANGVAPEVQRAMLAAVDRAVGDVTGARFVATPCARSDELSDALDFAAPGGIWVKDESGGVAGSHKARHLLSILLHLLAAERVGHLRQRPPLAIASCGNAALGAAVLARAAHWPIEVYVPTWMDDHVGRRLEALGATITRCPRRDDDPPGDPAMFRFREAVAAGAIPFTVQGPENALCLDGGRTLGWEIADALSATEAAAPDRVFAQVGGGAFAASVGRGLVERGLRPRLHAVHAEGCAPLVRAWDRAAERACVEPLGRSWSELMTVWERPASVADGILDDETYDWLGVFDSMCRTGGSPIVATEAQVVEAHDRAVAAGFDVSPTGSAGLAGLLAARAEIAPTERLVVVMTGVSA